MPQSPDERHACHRGADAIVHALNEPGGREEIVGSVEVGHTVLHQVFPAPVVGGLHSRPPSIDPVSLLAFGHDELEELPFMGVELLL
jgi:hypothetical protein